MGREIWKDNAKLAAEYIYYRKVGDHATSLPSSVYFGKKKGDILSITENIKYKYDRMSNICRIDENGEPVVWYKYDALNRLIREDNKTFGKTWLYSYDNKGNILCKRETAFTLKENVEECEFTSVQYEYDGDKLLSYGTEACAYDAIGNPTTYRGKSVSWSDGRQMVSYNGMAFTYDGLGRRLSKGDITYTYDSSNRVIKQSNGIEFIYDNSGVAGIVYNNATYIYRKDAQGNIVALIDSNGNVVVQYKYDAWGNHAVLYWNKVNDKEQYSELDEAAFDENYAQNKTLAELNPFRYRGYYYDDETELYYLKSRYYDPKVGRFITIDDISYLDPETINGLNLYAYCGNNPVMRVDENGNAWWHWLLGIFAIVVLAAVVVVSAVLTGGAACVAMGIGFAIGATANFVGQGINNVINGNGFFENISIGAMLIGGLAGAAFAGAAFVPGLGGVAGAFGIGFAVNVATSSIEKKSIGELLFNGLIGGLSASIAFGFSRFLGNVIYGSNDFTFNTFFEAAKVDGANIIKSSLTAFAASWYKFIPNLAPGITRAILNMLGGKGGSLFAN